MATIAKLGTWTDLNDRGDVHHDEVSCPLQSQGEETDEAELNIQLTDYSNVKYGREGIDARTDATPSTSDSGTDTIDGPCIVDGSEVQGLWTRELPRRALRRRASV